MKRKTGFTLMELMIAIAIISILAAVATPPVLQWFQNRKIVSATQTVFSSLQSARLQSVKENELTIVSFDSSNSYRVFLDLNQNHVWDAGTDRMLDRVKLPDGVIISSAAFPAGTKWIGFNGQGFPSSAGSIGLADTNGRTSQVSVNITGNMQVSD